jgi:hypothetical protein
MERTQLKERIMSNENTGTTQPACKKCRGTGRISLSPPELPVESGIFCDDCETGRQRWKEVSKLIDQIETGRLTTVFVAKPRPEPTSRRFIEEGEAELVGLLALWLVMKSPRDTLINLAVWLETEGSPGVYRVCLMQY